MYQDEEKHKSTNGNNSNDLELLMYAVQGYIINTKNSSELNSLKNKKEISMISPNDVLINIVSIIQGGGDFDE